MLITCLIAATALLALGKLAGMWGWWFVAAPLIGYAFLCAVAFVGALVTYENEQTHHDW